LLAVRGALGEETDCPASATGGILQRWILRGLRRATVIACDSLATLRDAERLVGPGPALKLVPIGLNYPYHAQPRESAIAQLGAIRDFTRPFVLHVGSGQRRKNREAVLRIFARCKNRWPGQLVFAGEKLSTEQNSLGEELGISADIIEIENPDNEMLNALYSAAAVLLFPSRFEGFGWPVIEAQACGCPVICSNAGPLAEVAGDGALLRDVEDEEGFAADLLRLLDPAERARWSEKSLRNASRFSAKKMIANYIDLYRTLAPAL
jgi:glycosyltransferase involved in cell wall biosynthesis